MADTASWARTARRLTEAAARACAPWIGAGDKDAADAAAVEALRSTAQARTLNGQVVIGEGEKDDAPYLEPGARVGEAPPEVDIAVDPLEGTSLVANEAPGALSVLAFTPAGTITPLGRAFYMEKLMGPPAVTGALDLDAAPGRVVSAVAEALSISPSEVRVAVQKRPRHEALVEALRDAGAQVHLFGEGDLSFALLALQERTDDETLPIDLLWGIGGAPEGVLAAAAQRVVGGAMALRLSPRSEAERQRLHADSALPGVLDRTFAAGEVVDTDAVAMTLTGVTEGPLLSGLQSVEDGLRTETLVLTPSQAPRRVTATHEQANSV